MWTIITCRWVRPLNTFQPDEISRRTNSHKIKMLQLAFSFNSSPANLVLPVRLIFILPSLYTCLLYSNSIRTYAPLPSSRTSWIFIFRIRPFNAFEWRQTIAVEGRLWRLRPNQTDRHLGALPSKLLVVLALNYGAKDFSNAVCPWPNNYNYISDGNVDLMVGQLDCPIPPEDVNCLALSWVAKRTKFSPKLCVSEDFSRLAPGAKID